LSYSIAFIAPYKKLGELFSEVCREINKDIPVVIGDLEEGVRKAVELEEQGVEVLISRGGTAIAIKKKVTNLPVVEVQVSGYDLIRVLHQVQQETDRVAVVGFSPFTYGIEDLGDIIGLNLKVITLKEDWHDQSHYIEKKLIEIKEQNYHWVVGDTISIKIAKQLGMNALLIRSGKEALTQAILEAERVAQVRRQEIEKTKRIESIINFAYDGIIGIDQRGIIDTFNPRAEEIFEKKAYKVIGKNIKEILPTMDFLKVIHKGYEEKDKMWTIGDKKIVANVIPIKINNEIVRVIATFHRISQIQKMEQRIREELYLKGHVAENTFEDIIGQSPAIVQAKEEAENYAQVDSPLLIYGETGTGKELFAQAIHNASPRKNNPFVAFNCAAIPENLLESELFGYVEGAFTGAKKGGKMGLFEQAHKGTIFLDEIGEISTDIQARLLRVLQERKVRRVGDDKLTPIDVRIIVSTNKDLYQLVEKKKFREDLYYRINVLNLNLPPIWERREDVPLLVNFFIKKYRQRLKKAVEGISTEGIQILENYTWPGNVRQLENIMERLMVRTQEDYIRTSLVREIMNSLPGNKLGLNRVGFFKSDMSISLMGNLEGIERNIIKRVIQEEKGNKAATAKRLGIGRTTLWRKLNK
jgi:PAS domain S-box-containing protein